MIARRGAALLVVLLCIALASALCAGSVAVARGMARAVRLSSAAGDVYGAAEVALASVIIDWDTSARARQAIGIVTEETTLSTGLVTAAAWVTRIGDEAWWVVAEARVGSGPGPRRRVGVVIHTPEGVPAPIPVRSWALLP